MKNRVLVSFTYFSRFVCNVVWLSFFSLRNLFIRINPILANLTLTIAMATIADYYFSQCYSVEITKNEPEQKLAKLDANKLAHF